MKTTRLAVLAALICISCGAGWGPRSSRADDAFEQMHPRAWSLQECFDDELSRKDHPDQERLRRVKLWAEGEKPNLGWTKKLPNCPCTITITKDASQTRCQAEDQTRWDCQNAQANDNVLTFFHPGGARYELRQKTGTGPGQQCTYDAKGALITSGPAAGTPDLGGPLTAGRIEHRDWDVDQACQAICADGLRFGKTMEAYISVRPPNNGLNCPQNDPSTKETWYDPRVSEWACRD
jgi:hypothetical protein